MGKYGTAGQATDDDMAQASYMLDTDGYRHALRIYRVSRGECARVRENVPYVKVHRYNPKHLYPKLNGYGDNGQRSLKV